MRFTNPFVARITAQVPAERVLTYARNLHIPQIGELGEFDQAFTAESGVVLHSVYCLDASGLELWCADLLASEFEVLPRNSGDST